MGVSFSLLLFVSVSQSFLPLGLSTPAPTAPSPVLQSHPGFGPLQGQLRPWPLLIGPALCLRTTHPLAPQTPLGWSILNGTLRPFSLMGVTEAKTGQRPTRDHQACQWQSPLLLIPVLGPLLAPWSCWCPPRLPPPPPSRAAALSTLIASPPF